MRSAFHSWLRRNFPAIERHKNLIAFSVFWVALSIPIIFKTAQLAGIE